MTEQQTTWTDVIPEDAYNDLIKALAKDFMAWFAQRQEAGK